MVSLIFGSSRNKEKIWWECRRTVDRSGICSIGLHLHALQCNGACLYPMTLDKIAEKPRHSETGCVQSKDKKTSCSIYMERRSIKLEAIFGLASIDSFWSYHWQEGASNEGIDCPMMIFRTPTLTSVSISNIPWIRACKLQLSRSLSSWI